ncbi:hypothetical protein SAMN04487946_10920 [Halobellus clavatus]|uniref:Uncharacterized protein n=1 Tax=Halobellus clavatus TaxID=660517 RepID=A0A1H3I6E2_9EURY|nr:hypothetical protein SAMN04487946_10920 [Halobellus clavatus]
MVIRDVIYSFYSIEIITMRDIYKIVPQYEQLRCTSMCELIFTLPNIGIEIR